MRVRSCYFNLEHIYIISDYLGICVQNRCCNITDYIMYIMNREDCLQDDPIRAQITSSIIQCINHHHRVVVLTLSVDSLQPRSRFHGTLVFTFPLSVHKRVIMNNSSSALEGISHGHCLRSFVLQFRTSGRIVVALLTKIPTDYPVRLISKYKHKQ